MMRIFVASLALIAGASAAEACVTASARTAGVLTYDPTSAWPLRDRLLVTLRATEGCGQSDDEGIGRIDLGFTRRLANSVRLEIIDDGRDVLSADDIFDRSVTYDFTGRKTATVEFDLIVPRGQKVGDEVLDLDLVYRAANLDCESEACRMMPQEDRVAVPLALKTKSIARIAFSGGRSNGSIDFGVLETNDARQVAVEVTATTPFKVAFDSENDGVLLLEGGSVAKTEETVPYALTFNGQSVGETVPYLDSSSGGTGGQKLNMMLDVKITDADAKRAGEYRDVVTIRIEPSLDGGPSS